MQQRSRPAPPQRRCRLQLSRPPLCAGRGPAAAPACRRRTCAADGSPGRGRVRSGPCAGCMFMCKCVCLLARVVPREVLGSGVPHRSCVSRSPHSALALLLCVLVFAKAQHSSHSRPTLVAYLSSAQQSCECSNSSHAGRFNKMENAISLTRSTQSMQHPV